MQLRGGGQDRAGLDRAGLDQCDVEARGGGYGVSIYQQAGGTGLLALLGQDDDGADQEDQKRCPVEQVLGKPNANHARALLAFYEGAYEAFSAVPVLTPRMTRPGCLYTHCGRSEICSWPTQWAARLRIGARSRIPICPYYLISTRTHEGDPLAGGRGSNNVCVCVERRQPFKNDPLDSLDETRASKG